MPQPQRPAIAVYGATGHTGGFILDELARRGVDALAVGRRPAASRTGVPVRVAALDDAAALARAFAGCEVVINAAGPYLDTAAPIVEAALAAGGHYIDLAAEQQSARDTFRQFDALARPRQRCVVPAAGFYGGLADLLATALAQAPAARLDAVTVAVALDRWWPTAGTRRTGARNTFPRMHVDDGVLVELASPVAAPWDFGAPEGVVAMEETPMSEVVTLYQHLGPRSVRSLLSANALRDLRDSATPRPSAADASGRSAQRFTLQVQVEHAEGTQRATARGRDIYAVSAAMVAEAAARLLRGDPVRAGTRTLGEAFDAGDMLAALAPVLDVHFEPLAAP